MLELVRERPRFGYRRIGVLLRRENWRVNTKRVYRLWRQEGLKVPQRKRKRRSLGTSSNACHCRRAEHKDHVWTWDFIFDTTMSGSPLKWLSIVDEYTRECLTLKVDRSITSKDVIDTLAELFAMRGAPQHIRSDNGPEFIAQAIRRWTEQLGIETLYIEPGAPWENGYAESFHSKARDEFLAIALFENLAAARKLTTAWRDDYNHHRPHSSLGYLTPVEFAGRHGESPVATHCCSSVRATPSLQNSSDLTQPVLS
jgi:transposase InsO family protein